jgi:hypothetical protein
MTISRKTRGHAPHFETNCYQSGRSAAEDRPAATSTLHPANAAASAGGQAPGVLNGALELLLDGLHLPLLGHLRGGHHVAVRCVHVAALHHRPRGGGSCLEGGGLLGRDVAIRGLRLAVAHRGNACRKPCTGLSPRPPTSPCRHCSFVGHGYNPFAPCAVSAGYWQFWRLRAQATTPAQTCKGWQTYTEPTTRARTSSAHTRGSVACQLAGPRGQCVHMLSMCSISSSTARGTSHHRLLKQPKGCGMNAAGKPCRATSIGCFGQYVSDSLAHTADSMQCRLLQRHTQSL